MDKQACAIILPFLLLLTAGTGAAQTTSVQSTVEAYGARLNNPSEPTKPLNARRYNNRIDSRLDNRISLRIERFRIGSPMDPLASIRSATQKSAIDAYRNVDGASSRATAPPQRSRGASADVEMTDTATTALDEDDSRNTRAPR